METNLVDQFIEYQTSTEYFSKLFHSLIPLTWMETILADQFIEGHTWIEYSSG